MAQFCLIKPLADKFKQALRDGTIDPVKLSEMTSAERRAFLQEIVGKESAADVNALFESKLLLKDTQSGMIQWAKQVTGITPEVRRRLVDRIEKMDERILDAKEQAKFMEDLAEQRLGTKVTFEEAAKITELSKKVQETRANVKEDRLAYGLARVEMENFINDIKRENNKTTLQDIKANPTGSAVRAVSDFAGLTKSLKASIDLSAFLRQGGKAVFTHPKSWFTGMVKTFKDVGKQLKNKPSNDDVMNAVKADVYSRENALNGTYERMGLDVGKGEEAYPTSLPEKVPGIGRVFKASEVGYQGFLTRLRADIADQYIKIALDNGVDLKDPLQARSIGKLVNSLTGRGNLGSFENAGKTLNNVFFSPKNVKAQFDFLTGHTFEEMSPFARKEAAKNLLKVASGVAAILAIANTVDPDSVELDPRSADFGKIRVKDTRFDVSSGVGSFATLAARLLTGSTKSSISGAISELGSGFGQQSKLDMLVNFMKNKASPFASTVGALATGEDREGNKPTIAGIAKDLLIPLPITNAYETFKNPNSAPLLAVMLLDALGVASNTYSPESKYINTLYGDEKNVPKNDTLLKELDAFTQKSGKKVDLSDWNKTTSRQVTQFKSSMPIEKFNEAQSKYTEALRSELEKTMASNGYKIADDTKKAKLLGEADNKAQEQVFKEYGFKYDKSIEEPVEIPEDLKVDRKTLVDKLVLGAKAAGTDPVTFFNRLLAGETIDKIRGNAIIYDRMSSAESEFIKRAGKGANKGWKLDHTIPLELGGSNDVSNLKLITTSEHASNSPVENKLGRLLEDGKIDRKEAWRLIKEYKDKKITADKILSM